MVHMNYNFAFIRQFAKAELKRSKEGIQKNLFKAD